MRLPSFRLDSFELEGDNELRRVARLLARLEALIKYLTAKPRVFDLDYFLDALSKVGCVVVVIGNPGTGKTDYLTRIMRGRATVCGKAIPTPGLGLAFTNADMAELRHRTEDAYGFRINTLHAEAVGRVRINSMVGYAIEVPGSKRVVKIRRGDYEFIREFVDIALAQERLRAIVAHEVGLPYSMDPFTEALGNRVFHVFDIYVHTQGVSDIEGLINKLLEFDPRLSRAIRLYVNCLSGKVNRVGEINCSPAYDFTTVLPKLLNSIPAVDGGIISSLVIDEYQDWSPLMNAILANWIKYVDSLVVAGDPDQLIYHSLNGAKEDAFLSIYKAVKEGRVKGEIIHLSQSHRVLEPLNRLAVGVLRRYTKPQDWDGWVGRKEEGSVPMIHVKTWGQVRNELLELYNNNKLKRYFILAPVNAGVLYATRSLLSLGIVPFFLKSVPSKVNHYVNIARKAIKNYIEDKATILGALSDDINKYIPNDLKPEAFRIVRNIINFAFETATREKQSGESDFEALERVINDYLNPKTMTYASNPNAYLYVDTIHTAKGLEANHVVLLNWDTKKREVDGYLARLWYVGLTRSRGSITIVLPPENTKFVSAIPLSVILSEAKKAGIEVVNHAKQA
jgi:superfamily I DNA/RNA helicase